MEAERQLSPKKEALRDLRRERWERRWRAVIQSAKEGRHVSLERLIELMSASGVPDFARPYAADRFSGRVARAGRPVSPPLDPTDLDSLWHHFTPRRDLAMTEGVASLVPLEFLAVADVRRRHGRYVAFKTTREPSRKNKPRLRYIASRSVWIMRDAKGEARRQVAARWGIESAKLEDWERRVRAWEREVRIFRLRSRLGNLLLDYLRRRSSEKRSGS